MPLKWTNKSRPPSSGVMKPKPLSSLNHLTVPVGIYSHFTLKHVGLVRSPDRTAKTYQGPFSDVLWRSPLAQLGGDGGNLVHVAFGRSPRKPQGVGGVARDHVDVEMEHGLPGRAPARVEQVDAVGAETLARPARDPLGAGHRRGQALGSDPEQVAPVRARAPEPVSARGRAHGHERDRAP